MGTELNNMPKLLNDNLNFRIYSERHLTFANEHADFGVQEPLCSTTVARHELEYGQEGADVAESARFILQLFVHGRLVDTFKHVAFHFAQLGKHGEAVSFLP